MLSEPIRELLARVGRVERSMREATSSGSPIELNYTTGRAAGAYERLRYLVDYRDEHTIRRNAIERILKRIILFEGNVDSGLTLLQELVDGSYISPEEATDVLAEQIQRVVSSFLSLRRVSHAGEAASKRLLSFAATEIESRLSPLQYAIDQEVVEALYQTARPRLVAPTMEQEELHAQLYCACWRSLLHADDDRLGYALWLLYVPEWKAGGDMDAIAEKLPQILARIRAMTRQPLQWQLASKIRNESVYFRIIRELLVDRHDAAGALFEERDELDDAIRELLSEKYRHENERIRASGIRAVVFLFVTKMAIAFLVELPYDHYMYGSVSYFPLAVNALFHPLLLFALTRRAGSLDHRNTEAVVAGIHAVLSGVPGPAIRLRNGVSRFALAFGIAYAALVFLVFGTIIGFLEVIGFGAASVTLFMLFFALVSYFAVRIRRQAFRWYVVPTTSFLSLLGDLVSVPIVRFGGWLSRTFSSINVVVFVMDFIVETPLKRMLNFLHQFMIYLREKADELR